VVLSEQQGPGETAGALFFLRSRSFLAGVQALACVFALKN
jgi:hypothetical protein